MPERTSGNARCTIVSLTSVPISSASGAAYSSGMAKGVPSGITPRADLIDRRPIFRASSSRRRLARPQPGERTPVARDSTSISTERSSCWKCCGRRNNPSDQMTRFRLMLLLS